MKKPLNLQVNGQAHEILVEPSETLNSVLRKRLRLTGTKRACDTGGCGSCTVLLDGKAVYSCMTYALSIDGHSVTTIEGLSIGNVLHPIQEAFVTKGALQCGFCTPGLIMTAKAVLDANPNPTDDELREGLAGNLCRCTGYVKIFEAIKEAGRELTRRKRHDV